MKYNGFYFRLFTRPMKKVLSEKYGRQLRMESWKRVGFSTSGW